MPKASLREEIEGCAEALTQYRGQVADIVSAGEARVVDVKRTIEGLKQEAAASIAAREVKHVILPVRPGGASFSSRKYCFPYVFTKHVNVARQKSTIPLKNLVRKIVFMMLLLLHPVFAHVTFCTKH